MAIPWRDTLGRGGETMARGLMPRVALVSAAAALVVGSLLWLDRPDEPWPNGRAPADPIPQRPLTGCELDALLVPSCGVLLGVTSPRPELDSLLESEQVLGRQVDFVYRFHWLDDDFPTSEELALVRDGRLLHYSLDTHVSDPSSPYHLTWSQVAQGAADDRLRVIARNIAAAPTTVWMTFEHEADQQGRDWQGSGADFGAAWRRVRAVFDQEGADNVVWTWVVMGTGPRIERAAELWPGNDVVDWISWEAYDPAGCRVGSLEESKAVDFEASFALFYRWYRSEGARRGMDPDLPIMISESGSSIRPGQSGKRADWYAEIPAVLARYPQVKAIGLWDHDGNALCDYRLAVDPLVVDAVRRAVGQDRLGAFTSP